MVRRMTDEEGFERADHDHDGRAGRYRAPGIKPVERGGGEGHEFGLAPSASPMTLVPDWIHPGDRVTAFELARARDEGGAVTAAALDALTKPCPRCSRATYSPDGERLCASCERITAWRPCDPEDAWLALSDVGREAAEGVGPGYIGFVCSTTDVMGLGEDGDDEDEYLSYEDYEGGM